MWQQFFVRKNVTNLSDYFSENSEICQNYRHSRWLNFQKRIRFHKIFTKSGSVLREWILKVREVKSEMKIWFTHFEKWKVKWKSVSLISRMKSEMKMPWDREWKVKWKCLEIEIKKWNVNKILENSRETRLSQVTEKWWQKETKIGRNFCHQNWWFFRHLKTHQFLQITKIFTKIGDKKTQNWVQLLSPELVKFSSLKNSPISSNHRNFHQNWWQKKHKIWWNYCHQNWWHFRHSKTHQILQFTEIFAKIGDKKSTKFGGIIVTRIGEIFVT